MLKVAGEKIPSAPKRAIDTAPQAPSESQDTTAKVAELADALDLGSSGATREGSSPSFRMERYEG